jgi:hypothetical protein
MVMDIKITVAEIPMPQLDGHRRLERRARSGWFTQVFLAVDHPCEKLKGVRRTKQALPGQGGRLCDESVLLA